MRIAHSWETVCSKYQANGVTRDGSYEACKRCGIKRPPAHEQELEDHICLGIKEPEAKIIRDLLLDTGVIHRFEAQYHFCWQEIIAGPIRRFVQLEAGKEGCYKIQEARYFHEKVHLNNIGSDDQAIALFVPTTGYNAVVWRQKTIVVPPGYRSVSITPPGEGACTLRGSNITVARGLLIRLD